METLFRFSLKRTPVEQAEEFPSIQLVLSGDLRDALKEAASAKNPRAVMKAAARAFVASDEFVSDLADLKQSAQLRALRETFEVLFADGTEISKEELHKRFHEAMDVPLSEFIVNETWQEDERRLHNSIMAIKLLPEEHRRPLHKLVRTLRDKGAVAREEVDDDVFPKSLAVLKRYLERSIRLPAMPKTKPVIIDVPREGDFEDEVPIDREKVLEELLEDFRANRRAVEELAGVRSVDVVETLAEDSPSSLPPEHLRASALFARSIEDEGDLSPALGISEVQPPPEGSKVSFLARQTVMAKNAGVVTLQSGRPAFHADDFHGIAFRLNDSGRKKLSGDTLEVLKKKGLKPDVEPLDELVETLERDLGRIGRELDDLGGRPQQHSFKRYGRTLVKTSTPITTPWATLGLGTSPMHLPPHKPVAGGIPDSHGEIAPAGVHDLLVVRQQLTGYEPVDISRIENALKGEKRRREHRQRQETEELLFVEREVTTREERELESTDRFEMSRETEETVKEEASIKAGLTVSGKYGPTVEFSASAEGSLSRTREEAVRTASSFSREVTDRSARKITERVLERESRRVTREVEEVNEHGIDNSGGDGHVTGIYQWVNKVYQAQIFNFGLRTIYDFMVAEPGAFLMESFRRTPANVVELDKPLPFTMQADELSPFNYQFWVHEYGATNVAPPPPVFITKSFDFNAGGGDDKTNYQHSAQIQIDDGFEAFSATAGVVYTIWDENATIDLVLGRRTNRFQNDGQWVWATSMDNERGSLPLALITLHVGRLGVAIKVRCRRTEHAMDRWRQETHATLMQAYRARLSEYEEKLAALEAQADADLEGRNPEANQEFMNDELKKACISILTAQHYDLFNAIETGSNGLPQLNLSENALEGPYVRFFEQAFEWQNMTWITYPYFWGRKAEWTSRITIEDSDPLFERFLKAGYCRVTVPVRPGFESAVDHFMTFGELWNGGPLPPISDDLYLPIADELAEQLERPGDEVPEGEPWIVKLPTNLVKLRQDATLPTWQQDENGTWVPMDGG